MTLQRTKYQLFTSTDFSNIVGKSLDEVLANEGSGHNSEYFITYTSLLISNFITTFGGRKLFRVEGSSPNDFKIKFGRTLDTATTLTEEDVEKLKLACVYQADYMLDNGSPERMSGLSISSRTAVISKEQLSSYKICDLSFGLLLEAGLLYSGLGANTNAWFK